MVASPKQAPDESSIPAWFRGRIPEGWFTGPPEVSVDREEILVIGSLSPPETEGLSDADRDTALVARIQGFREDTRAQRIRIADEAEARFGRKVSWGAECGAKRGVFTSLSIPVMTRLRMPERRVLDTLVDAGVARSRSDALAWCVRLVETHEGDWIDQLRDALVHVEEVRAQGPASTRPRP
jgi:hypothetical protein